MRESEVQRLLGRLYGGGLDEQGLVPFMTELGRTMHAHVVAIQAHDLEHRSGQIDMVLGLSPDWQLRYAEWAGQHPWYILGGVKLLAEGMADDEGLLTEAELQATPFHEVVLKPADVSHGAALLLHAGGHGQMAVMTVNRDHRGGYYTPDERQLMRTLLPHLRTVYALWQQLSWLREQAQTFRAALDGLADGVLLLDASVGLLFANQAAQRMEAQRLFARHPDGRLGLPRPADELALREALHRFGVQQSAAPFVMQIHEAHGRLIGTLKACPVARFAGPCWSEPRAHAIVFVKSLSPTTAASIPELLRQQWHFTPAEARLALALVRGATLDEATESLGISKNTVRTQLRALFDKTDTRRQAELLRVLLKLTHT